MVENDNEIWDRLAADIVNAVDEACKQFGNLPAETIEARPNSGAWSVKEIVGHLLDSASNNHQRFVRLQVADVLSFPDYSQDNDSWVTIQRYQDAPWDDLIAIWRYFNLHLARVIRSVNEDCIDHIWIVDKNRSVTLSELMIDYLRHLKDHIQQIRENIDTMK